MRLRPLHGSPVLYHSLNKIRPSPQLFNGLLKLPSVLLRIQNSPFTSPRTFFKKLWKIFTSSASVPRLCFFSRIASMTIREVRIPSPVRACLLKIIRTARHREHIHSEHIFSYTYLSPTAVCSYFHADLVTCLYTVQIEHDCGNKSYCFNVPVPSISLFTAMGSPSYISVLIYSDTSVCRLRHHEIHIQLLFLYKIPEVVLRYGWIHQFVLIFTPFGFIINNISLRSSTSKTLFAILEELPFAQSSPILISLKERVARGNQMSDITVPPLPRNRQHAELFFVASGSSSVCHQCSQQSFPHLCLHLMSGTVDRLDRHYLFGLWLAEIISPQSRKKSSVLAPRKNTLGVVYNMKEDMHLL